MKTTTNSQRSVRFPTRSDGASALLLVLWAVVTMSLAVLGVVQYVTYNLDEAKSLNRDFRIRQIAESGLAFAFSPQVEEGDPLLYGTMDDDGHYEVVLHSETARLNVNALLKTGQDEILENLFLQWKLTSSESRMVTQRLVEWMGRTGETVETLAVSRTFETVDQMADVKEMRVVEKKHPEWRDAFTVWGDGKIDVNDATAEVIAAVFGIGERRAESFVQYRLGPDKTEHTLDDQPYQQMEIIAGALGLSNEQMQEYAPLISLESQIMRVESTGTLGNSEKRIEVVLNRKATPVIIYKWEEI